jgi:hypothetical protein
MLYLVIGSILVTLFHRDNISRLLKGTENKLGSKKPEQQKDPTLPPDIAHRVFAK